MKAIKVNNFLVTIKSYTLQFWLLNSLQLLEKFAYWLVLIQMPVYIAQKDVHYGLKWEQTAKGMIFFVWALVQNITPIFSGGYADKYGRKKFIQLSFVLIVIGYFLLGTQKDFYLFLLGTVFLGFGSGLFKPSVQGFIASTLNDKNTSIGWSIYFMLLNVGVLFAAPISKYIKDYSIEYIFYSSLIIIVICLLISFFIKKPEKNTTREKVLSSAIIEFKKPYIYSFMLIISGFIIIYMQFYETLPNFIVDWTDSSSLVQTLKLPEFMLSNTNRGLMLAFEWFYTINSLLIILFIVPVSWLIKKCKIKSVLIIGVLLSTFGLFLSGLSMIAVVTLSGIILYTFGEMIVNPKITEHFSKLSNNNNKSLYMGFLSLAQAIGLGFGSLIGSFLYMSFSEKSSLINNFIWDEIDMSFLNINGLFEKLNLLVSQDNVTLTLLLWDNYHPYLVWIPFVIIGICTSILIFLYFRKFTKEIKQ